MSEKERIKEVFDTYPDDELTVYDVSSHSGVGCYPTQEIIKELVKKKCVKNIGRSEYNFKKYKKA